MNLIKNLRAPEKKFGTGGINDPYDENDFRHEELGDLGKVSPPVWLTSTSPKWRKFPIFNQSSSSSCVGQTIAKILGIENFKEEGKFINFSARDIYSLGVQPGGGMIYRDAIGIGYKRGATLEELMPSQNLPESEMVKDNDRSVFTEQVALVGKGGNYFSLPFNFDDIAGVVAQGKAVCLGTRFNSGDWNTGEVKINPTGKYGHGVAVVDFCLWKGQKALVFDNSWDYKWGFDGQGVITEDQKAGIVAAWYYADLPNDWRDNLEKSEKKRPKFRFLYDLKVGFQNSDVTNLQECLKWDGDFPFDIPSTGYFGGITLEAVKKFQEKYNIFPVLGFVGPLTREKLNEIFDK